MSSNDRRSKHQALIKIIQTRKREQLKEHPRGTRLNGTSANVPSNTNLRITQKKLRDRKSIANKRKKENEKLKKQPLPMEEMEEFIGMKPVGKRNWTLDESQFLRFKSARRHSANSRSSRNKDSPVKNLENNQQGSFFKRFVGRYEPSTSSVTSSVHSRPAPVRYGKGNGKGKGKGTGKRIVENI
jgi:hypothetical protein